MNVCGSYPRARQVFRSYSTNNLSTKGSGGLVMPLRITSTDFIDVNEPFLKSSVNAKSILRHQDSLNPAAKVWGNSIRPRSQTMSEIASERLSEQTTNSMKQTKSFNESKLTRDEKKHTLKRFSLFNKKEQRFGNIRESSKHESHQSNVGKKIKPLLLRSLSSSCLSLAGKSRPKLINRSSCPHSLIPSPQDNQDNPHRVSDTNQGDLKPTGVTYTTKVRPKDSFKDRHISRRDSQILVTRFELEQAITKDDRRRLLTFINSKTFNINAKDYYGKTLLHTACSVGNYNCAQILINAGAQVDSQDQAGFTPLHCAVVANHVPCAAVLIAAGADVMACTRTMHTALTLAHEEEMILLIGRSLLLQGTQRKTAKKNDKYFSLRETKL